MFSSGIVKIRAWTEGHVDRIIMRYEMKNEHISHIAMFHKLSNADDVSDDQDECRLKDFISYITYCQKLGLEFVSLDALLAMSPQEACKNKVVITFDDGFESLYSVAYKELSKRNIPYTCFISTSLLGRAGYISKQQLKILSKEKICSIGMNADQHILWRDESSDKLQQDYIKCKHLLKDIIGYEPKNYAFPYGTVRAVSKKNMDAIKHMNPQAILLTRQRKLTRTFLRNPLCGLPRLDIAGYYKGYYKKEDIGLDL